MATSVHLGSVVPERRNDTEDDILEPRAARAGAPATPKKKKHTYTVRKEKKVALLSELRRLQREVDALKRKKLESAKYEHQTPGFKALAVNQTLRTAAHAQELALAGAQSAINSHVSAQSRAPYQATICLGGDVDERRRVLTQLKPLQLSSARRFLLERTQYTDLHAPFTEAMQFRDADGLDCETRFDVMQLHNVSSVRQVFDAMKFAFFNLEIIVSKVGEISLREEDNSLADLSISQARFLSFVNCSDDNGNAVEVEKNNVIFSDLCAFDAELGGGGPSGIISANFVHSDALFPYDPVQRLRKEFTSIWSVRALEQGADDGIKKPIDGADSCRVAIVYASILKLRKPQGVAVSEHVMSELSESNRQWGRVTIDAVRELVG